tara:strand:+ start:141 stop:614 length:474 start_codon:yes stop_codon:yes gene_type:complete
MVDKNQPSSNSIEDIHHHLLMDYRMKILEIEMGVHQARQNRANNKVQRYFNSTPIKNAFARWMTYGVYTNKFYTISQLVKEMHSNRQTISTMINECEAEGYIIVKRVGSTVSCQATPLLVEKMEDYCEWRKELTKSTIGTAYNNLAQFEKLMQKRFA